MSDIIKQYYVIGQKNVLEPVIMSPVFWLLCHLAFDRTAATIHGLTTEMLAVAFHHSKP